MPRLMIIPKGAPVMAAVIGVAGTSLLPVASADTLSNGLTVDCKPDSAIHSTCIIGGCPRVDGDYVVDAVHVMINGGDQQEYDFKCINGQTARVGVGDTGGGQYNVGVQACRKVAIGSDKCTPYANYTYMPPAKPATPAAPAPAPNADRPVHCTTGYELPPGSDCSKTPNPNPPAAPAAVTNAIQLSFSPVSGNGVTGKSITARSRPETGVKGAGRRFCFETYQVIEEERTYARACTSITDRSCSRQDRRAVRLRS